MKHTTVALSLFLFGFSASAGPTTHLRSSSGRVRPVGSADGAAGSEAGALRQAG
jgi:hypothetical protein